MSYRFAFSLAALERQASGAAFPGLSPCWSNRLRPPNTTTDAGSASYIAFLSFGRPGKLPRGVLFTCRHTLAVGALKLPMTTLKLPMVVSRLGL